MNTLGISAFFHDAAAALVCDGQLVGAVAEERLSRQRHDPSFPSLAVSACLARGQICVDDIDQVVFYEEPHTKFTRVVASTLAGFPGTRGAFVEAMHSWLGGRLFLRNKIASRLGVSPDRVAFASHHESHAAYAVGSSGFDDCAVLVIDAVGEWACTSLWTGGHGARPTLIEQFDYPHSLGLVYAAFTAFLGFRPNSDECSTMALAAFGEPSRTEEIERVLRLDADGSYEVIGDFFDFLSMDELPVTAAFIDLFGEPASPGAFSELEALGEGRVSEGIRPYVDLAASLQDVLERAILGLARRLHARTGRSRLCLAGGVALNCVANRRLLDEGPFDELHIPPDPGDGGGAIGACLVQQPGAVGLETPYLGEEADPGRIAGLIDHLPASVFAHNAPFAERVAKGVRVHRLGNEDELERVAVRLARGEVVGWVQGRFEYGPRALGHRSLLCAPGHLETARTMSRTIKCRAPFRPYALSVTEAAAPEVFTELPSGRGGFAWMQSVVQVRDEHLPSVRAATHVDGTTRPQICAPSDAPAYHRLLECLEEGVGVQGVLNTSLNERGSPIVASAEDALLMFVRTDMDALVVGDLMLEKEWS